MQDVVLNFVLGIVGSIVAAFLFELMRTQIPMGIMPAAPGRDNNEAEDNHMDQRARNKQAQDDFILNVVFYAWTFFVLYSALLAAPYFRAMVSRVPIYLDYARTIGTFVPSIEVMDRTFFQVPFFIVTALLYIPVLYITYLIATPFEWIANTRSIVTVRKRRMIHMYAFLVMALLVCGLSVYEFHHHIPFKYAMATPFVGLFFIFAASQSSNSSNSK